MRTSLALFITAALFSSAAFAQTPIASFDNADPVYVAGSQYTAILDQASQHWQLLPASGQVLDISSTACKAGAPIADGVWLLVLDADGRPSLVAPSTTALPAGAADHVALRACDESAGDDAVFAPQELIDLLAINTGAIYVQ
jgi:hypothetical protein